MSISKQNYLKFFNCTYFLDRVVEEFFFIVLLQKAKHGFKCFLILLLLLIFFKFKYIFSIKYHFYSQTTLTLTYLLEISFEIFIKHSQPNTLVVLGLHGRTL